ncbi:protein of unknown function [Algoriphagus faecimaris]|uniref:PIN domain-containing protein n=1 Tax=Algoriphagus faecimaris TaxID=686796 RepID=A0A1G6UV19_9BACT|nr:DUF4411 family protein [Algoriphagus faecimaris]SDD44415.1 protein of unknown function [Algoriphagus faecimaris]
MKVFVVDSNFFIEAHRAIYPLDVAIGFWSKVEQLAQEGKIISIDKVKDELYQNNDELKKWCQNNLPEDFFKDTDLVLPQYAKISVWVDSKRAHFLPKAVNEFLAADEADAFLVAYGMADIENRIIVTREVSDPKAKKRIKIPDCCLEMGVAFLNPIEMFRMLGETF